MRNDINVLALGACGSNIGMRFFEQGFKVAFVNSSIEDLSVIKAPVKIHIKNGEGCAKNRALVKQLVMESIDALIQDITTALTAKYLVIPVGIGGGTGSGIAPSLISFLANMGHICIPVLVLPSVEESAKTCENAWNFITEISHIKNIGSMFLLDNSTDEDKFAINNKFVRDFISFLEINNESTMSNIDTREKKLLLETPGISVIGRCSKTKSSSTDLIESIKNGIYAPIENKNPKYIGLSTSNKSMKMSDFYSEYGESYDAFVGYSQSTNILYLAGLQLPEKRTLKFKNKFEKIVQNISTSNFIQSNTLTPLQGLSFMEPTITQKAPQNPRDMLMSLLQG